MSDAAGVDGPIEVYLDELVAALSTRRPRELRELLAEVEAHLRDAADEYERGGLDRRAAETEAVRAFGPVPRLVAAERVRQRITPAEFVGRAAGSAVVLGAVGAVAVGLSGVVALVFRLVGGDRAVVDAPSGAQLTADRCAQLTAGLKGVSCRSAAIADWADETVFYRLALGLLGLVALLVVVRLRRRLPTLPALVSDTIATSLFTAAAGWTLLLGVDAAILGGGYGQWLSAALVAAAAAAAFAVRTLRDLDAGRVP